MQMDAATSKLKSSGNEQILDGSNIMELVGNQDVFNPFVDHKFEQLDKDRDGELSVKELQPAVADIGAALGLPAQGTSPDSDRIYSEVLNEFTHGRVEKVSKTEFKKVLSDILLGMAAGLKRDPIVILRMDGEDLLALINGLGYESEMVSIFSHIDQPNASLHDHIIKALDKLTIDQGMPPSSDFWVMNNIVKPTIHSCTTPNWNEAVSQGTFLVEFKRVGERLAQRLKEHPVIVAHSENTFDGSSIRRLMSNKFELDKLLTAALESVPKDRDGKMSKDFLQSVLDVLAPSAGLPPLGAGDEIDKVVGDAFTLVEAGDGKAVKEEEFKQLMAEILGSVMLQLEGNHVSVSSNSVVHEPLPSSSTLLLPS